MSAVIYYFSGTGNTLRVARDIAEKIGAGLLPIASEVKRDAVKPDADVIGIVTPTYYGELPLIVRDFASRLDNLTGKYIFAVSTFGGSAGYSLKILRDIVKSEGGNIAASYGVHMPQNSFSKPWEKSEKLYAKWPRKLEKITRNTAAREKGNFPDSIWLAPFFTGVDTFIRLMKPQYRKGFIKLSGASDDLSTDELIRLNDTAFSVNDKCTGCGICVRVCPVDNIAITEGRLVWLHSCENCLACYNWCPVQAIEGGIAAKGYFYKRPGIGVTDIMAQKSGG